VAVRFAPRVILLLISVSCTGTRAFAQPADTEKGILAGLVVNSVTQEPLPLATVLVVGTSLGASTNEEGRFSLPGVPVGTYEVRVSLVGYPALIITDVVVRTGRPVDLVARLEEEAIPLEGVDATARYFRTSPDAPVSLQQFSAEEIRRSPGGFEDVLRAIAVLPGVGQAEPGRNDLVVRGGAPSENLFVLDNIEIANINHFGTQGASGGPLSFVNLDFVSETAFTTGGFGARFGDRMSSVLSIDLKDGRTDRWGGKGTISASQFGLNLEGPISQSGSAIFSIRRSYLDLIFKAAGFSFVPEYWDFLLRGNYTLDRDDRLTVLGIGAIDDVRFFNKDADDRFDNSRILGTDQRQLVGGVSWQHLFGSGIVTTTLSRAFVRYTGIQRDSLLQPVFSNLSTEEETIVRADAVFQVSKLTELSFGLQGRGVGFDADLALPGYVTSFGDTVGFASRRIAANGGKGAAYGQVTFHVTPALHVTAGGRVDYFSLIARKFVAAPRLSISYRVTDLTTIAASAGRYHQSPSYVWLAANVRNTGLMPARADQFVLGVEHLLAADLKARVEVYRKLYRDYPASVNRRYLVLSNAGGGFGGTDENFASFGIDDLVNGGRGRAEGVEFLLQKKLSGTPVYGIIGVTVGRTVFTALDGVERPGAFDQRVIFNLSGGYRFDERWEASAKFRLATGAPYTPFNADGTQDVDRYNSGRLKTAHSLDLRVDRRWNFSQWNLVVYLDVQNVYNKKFTGSARWNARERRVETDDDAIGVLPSIGVSAEF
jgi:hypothetical protein